MMVSEFLPRRKISARSFSLQKVKCSNVACHILKVSTNISACLLRAIVTDFVRFETLSQFLRREQTSIPWCFPNQNVFKRGGFQ